MSYKVQQSTTAYPLIFLMVDSTDHVTGKTGLSPTVTISKNGGSFASPSGAVTEIANGWYKVAGNATDSNTLGPLALHATGTAADPVDMLYGVVVDDLTTSALRPTTAGRTLDVSSGGEAGIDWANVGTPGSTVSLSATTVATVTTAATATTIGSTGLAAIIAAYVADKSSGVASYGVLDAGGASSFTLPTGQRLNVQAGDALWVLGKGCRRIAAGYNSTTGAGTTVSAGVSDFAASDSYVVFKDAKAEPFQSSDFASGIAIDGSIGSVGTVTGNVDGTIGSLAAQAKADVNTEADTALTDYAGLKPTVAGRTLDVTTTGAAGIDLANVESQGTTLALTGTTIAAVSGAVGSVTGNVGGNVTGSVGSVVGAVGSVTGAVGSVVGHTPQTGDTYARLGAPAGASHAADIASVKTDTGTTIPARLPAALTGAGNMKSDALAFNGSTTAAANLALSALGIIPGTAQTGTLSTTQMSTDLTFTNTDQVVDAVIVWTSGNNNRVRRAITAATPAGVLTFAATPATTANGDTFVIV